MTNFSLYIIFYCLIYHGALKRRTSKVVGLALQILFSQIKYLYRGTTLKFGLRIVEVGFTHVGVFFLFWRTNGRSVIFLYRIYCLRRTDRRRVTHKYDKNEHLLGFVPHMYFCLFDLFTNICNSFRNTLMYYSIFSSMYI